MGWRRVFLAGSCPTSRSLAFSSRRSFQRLLRSELRGLETDWPAPIFHERSYCRVSRRLSRYPNGKSLERWVTLLVMHSAFGNISVGGETVLFAWSNAREILLCCCHCFDYSVAALVSPLYHIIRLVPYYRTLRPRLSAYLTDFCTGLRYRFIGFAIFTEFPLLPLEEGVAVGLRSHLRAVLFIGAHTRVF